MPRKRSRRDDSSQQHGAAGDRKRALRDILHNAMNAGVEEAFQEMEQERTKAEEERARLLAEAQEAAAKVKEDAERHIKKMRRKLQQDRAALEEENVEIKRRLQEDRAALEQEVTSMEKAHTFQTSKILLNVGGHRFETSLQSLTSVPHTYFASLFSGRFELVSDAEGAYFIDRDGKNFHYILNFLRDSGSFKLSSNMMEEMQRDELAMELKFYGLLDRMMPFYTQERIGRALLKRVSRWLQVRAAAGGGSGTCARV
jgi:small-conductance mechanosensitive channel